MIQFLINWLGKEEKENQYIVIRYRQNYENLKMASIDATGFQTKEEVEEWIENEVPKSQMKEWKIYKKDN